MSVRVFYVSVVDGNRSGLLLGPFATHAEAIDQVESVRSWAVARDRRAHFYAFGTTSIQGTLATARLGRLNSTFARNRQIGQLTGGPILSARRVDSATFEPAQTVVRFA
jgi:hypothetical protein